MWDEKQEAPFLGKARIGVGKTDRQIHRRRKKPGWMDRRTDWMGGIYVASTSSHAKKPGGLIVSSQLAHLESVEYDSLSRSS